MRQLACLVGAGAALLIAAAGCTYLSAAPPAATGGREGTMHQAAEGLRYGFRYDPMKYVETDDSVPAALVRAQVFGTPKDGDEKVIADYVAEILAKQRPDGSFGDTSGDTGRSLDWLAVAGVGADRPEFMRGFEAMTRQRAAEAAAGAPGDYGQPGLVLVPTNGLRAACMTDLVHRPEVRRTVRWLADHPTLWLEKTCPWGATFVLRALWHARGVEDVDAGISTALDWIGAQMNDAGCVRYWDPYAVVAALGTVDTPQARALLLRQVPMLLRGQESSGGWGQNKWDVPTLDVFRALRTHGLLDRLRALPPLPPDWRVVRSIPAPDGDLGWMTYQAGRLYLHNYKDGEIIAVSPADGSTVRRFKVPGVFPVGLGQWDGSLAVTQKDGGKRVLKVDPDTGAIQGEFAIPFVADPMCATMVSGRLWIADSWLFPGWVVDPQHPEKVPSSDPKAEMDPAFRLERLQAGTCPNGIAVTPDGVWQTDYFARVMIKSGPDGKLVDWADRPFPGWPPDIAYDGKDLWALDPVNKRICVIEKAEKGAGPVRTAAGRGTAVRPDYAKLDLRSSSPEQDTFTLTLVEAARLLGVQADYDTVFALSTNGFAPDICPAENCKSTWRRLGRGQCIDLVAAYLGLDASPLKFPEEQPLPPPDAQGRTWGTPAYDRWLQDRKVACAAVIRQSLDGGAVVVTSGGWLRADFSLWGIVTGADPTTGAITGMAPEGPRGNVMDHIRSYWRLRPSGERLPLAEAERRMLVRAVDRIRGHAKPFAPGEVVFGLPAMDLWIAQMEKPDFQPGDPASSAGNARLCALYTLDGAHQSAADLRKMALDAPAAARPHLEAAAARYEAIERLLASFGGVASNVGYGAIMGDAAKQKAHAEGVLVPVKAELAAAADEMAAALAADGIGTEAAPAERATLSDLNLKTPGAEWFVMADRREPFAIVLQEVGRLLGRPMDYATLYALSAEGFAPTVTTWEDEIARVTWFGRGGDLHAVGARFGLRFERLQADGTTPQERLARYAALIRQRLGRGELLVVDGWMQAGPGWWGVVTDVRPDGAVLAASLNGRMDNALDDVYACWSVTTAEPAQDAHAAELQMLEQAVRRIRGAGDDAVALHGLPAMDYLIGAFEKDGPFCPNCPDEGAGCAQPCMQPVYNGFVATASYLRGRAPSFQESARPHVARAADRYNRILELLRPAVTGEGGESYRQFIGDLQKQKAHADVLRQIRAELSAAADEMAAALAAEGVSAAAPSQGAKPDYSKLQLQGDDLTRDSFSLSVQAAARLLGKDVDYDTVYALSTNCFAPGIRLEEPCKESWIQQARDRSMDLIGRYVGLSLAAPPNPGELNQIPPAPDAPWDTPAMDAWLRDWQRKPMVPHVRRLIADGSVIVSQGEWKRGTPGVAWCDWGVITGADDDGTIVGAGINGRSDNPTDYIREGWVLSAGEPSISRREADLEALRRAVHRIRGDAAPFLPDRDFVFGLEAMDRWIAQMEQPSFQPDSPADSKENAFATGMTVYSGAQASAAWMCREAGLLSEAAGPRVQAAAARYDTIVALLKPAITGEGGESYLQFIGDAAKQKAHADVLRRVRAELASAADEMAAALAAEARRPDYSKLSLNGNGHMQDSFTLAIQAADRMFGREADYGQVYALSSNCFAPAVVLGESCSSWWHVEGYLGGRSVEEVAAAVGLRAEPIAIPSYEGAEAREEVLALAATIRTAIWDGAVVICAGGWRTRTDQGFAPWGWWGVVTEAQDDGNLFGACLSADAGHPNGYTDRPMEGVRGACWALYPAEPSLKERDTTLDALRNAVARVRGIGAFAPVDDQRYGLPAMDAWIDRMEKVPFCQDCKDQSWTDALDNGRTTTAASQAAAAWLRKSAGSLSGAARPRMEAAAAHYDRIVALLKPAVTGEGGQGYQQFIGDLAKQRAHADVLRQVKAELAAAADEMETALTADGVSAARTATETEESKQMTTNTTRGGGRVEVEGVPAMGWGRSCDTAFAGAMEAALAATAHPYTATQVMGYSGLAFRVRWTPDAAQSGKGWCPSIPVGEFAEEQAAVAKATGWRFDMLYGADNAQDAQMGRYADRIAAAIDAGLPVVGYPDTKDMNPGVVIGYEGSGAERRFLWRTYWTGEGTRAVAAAETGPWLMVPQGFGEAPDGRRRLLDSLSIAVRNWRRGTSFHPNGYPYAWGESALQSWQRDLTRAADFSEADQKQLFFVDWWNYEALADARTRAAAFLKDEAPLLGAEGRTAVLRAAALYEQEGKLLAAQFEKPEGFLGPWSGKGFGDWTPAVRECEQGILAQALDLERQAVAEIEAALKAEEVSVPAPAASAAASSRVRRENGKVWIEGMEDVNWGGSFFAREDSQARCLAEALRCAGQDVTYSDVMGLSGAAFKLTMAPNLFIAEIHSEMGMDWQEIVSRVWGMNYELMDEGKEAWRDHLFSAAKESIGRGVPLIYMDGEFSLLVGYREDKNGYICKPYAGDKAGYTEFKFPHGSMEDAWFAIVLRPAGKPATRRDSALNSLRTAAELATHAPEADGKRLFGFAAYDAWIAALDKERKEVDARGNGFSYSQLLTSRKTAAEYLRKIAGEFGASAADHLRAAADSYDAIAKRLDAGKDCVAWPQERDWKAENRTKEAEILRQSLADEKVAVSEIASALQALGVEPAPPAAETSRAVLLQGAVADFKHIADDVAGHRPQVLARGATDDFYPQPYCRLTTMLVQMHAAGWNEMDIDTLAVVSGASAMFGYEPNEFGPKYAWHWRNPNALVAQATGYATEAVRAATAEDAWKLVKESLDLGRPVSAWEGEMMLLAGYRDAASVTERKVFAMKDGNGYYAEWWDWDRFSKWVGGGQQLYRHSGRVEPKQAKEVALRVMGDLVALSARVPQGIQSNFPKATFGLAGIEAWAADCADMQEHEDWGMCHPENPQWTVRNSTAVYLENVAKQAVLSPAAGDHVRQAAAQYRAAYAAWQQAYGLIGYAAPEGSGKVKERRLAAAAAVRRAADYERAAIAEIEAALAAEGVEVQPASAGKEGATAAASEVVLDTPGMPEGLYDKALGDRGCSYQAGVARAYVYALRQAGVDIDFTEFTALSGWAFSFVYKYGNCPQVGIRVRGTPGEAGPGETFQIADWFGLAYESAPTQDRDRFWAFVKEQIDAGRPVISEHGDGGLIVGYGEHDGKREARFESFMGSQWMDISDFEPFEVCALVPKCAPLPKRELYVKGLQRAVYYATMPEWQGAATGPAGLDAYLADVADQAKDFADHTEWFCWASRNRLDARVCAAEWLGRAARELGSAALRSAASHYADASRFYVQYHEALVKVGDSMVPRERWDLAGAVPLLRQAVEAERAGIGQLAAAMTELKVDPLPHVAGGAPASGAAAAPGPKREAGKVWLDGLTRFPSWITEPGCLVACSRYLGLQSSPDWVYGATGFAFALNIHRSLCPSGPTAWGDGDCVGLARNLGLRADVLFARKADAGFAQKQEEFYGRVRQAIDAGLPVIGWEMGVPDYYVVHGYDAEGNYLFRDFDGSVGRASKAKLGDTGIGLLYLMVLRRDEPADDRTTVRQALEMALDIAAGKHGHGGEYATGLAGYDRWIAALDQPEATLADENAGFGLAYNAACWSDCRSHAPGFLQEAQKRLNEPGLDADFRAAIASYQKVAAGMERVHDLFPAEHEQKPKMAERLRDAALRAQALEALRSARAAEAEGLRSLASLEEKLSGPGPKVAVAGAASGVMLDKLVARPRWVTHMGSIGGCLDFLGRPVSDGWLYGATGYGFALNIEQQLCPSAPHVWIDEGQSRLGRNVGYTMQTIANISEEDKPEKQRAAWDMVRKGLDEGAPCFAYDIEVGDYFVLNGYDATGYYYRALGSNQQRGPLAWERLGTTGNVGVVLVTSVRLSEPAGDRTAVMDALRFAVGMQRKGAATPADAGYMPGIRGYDAWIAALERAPRAGTDGPDGVNPHGASFNAQFWAECRRNAVGFLKEAKARLKDGKLDPLFDEAAADYQVVADRLTEVAGMFPMDGQWGPRLMDEALCARAVAALREARAAEEKGLLVLARIAGEPMKPEDLAPRPARVVLADVPPVGGEGNGYVRGIEVLLASAGTPVAYERLMGLSGMAFIAQADVEHRWEGKVDVGWWPLDLWGLELRLDFLGRAVGRGLQEAGWQALTEEEAEAARSDIPGFYRREIEPLVKRSIDAGRPVLAISDFGFVITGYDDAAEGPPVLGRCPRGFESMVGGPDSWPHGLIVLGTATKAMDSDTADVAALQNAVALAHDAAGPTDPRWRDRRFTGQKAFAAWAALLRDAGEPVEDRHHANMVGNLRLNRMAAVSYLRAVVGRHEGDAAAALGEAAASYESSLSQLSQMRWSGLAGSMDARRKLADQVDRLAATELEAAGHIQRALQALGKDSVVTSTGPAPVVTGNKHMLAGLECVPMTCAELSAVGGALRYLGRDVSNAWLYGATGHAFAINIRPTVCVSGPYAWKKTLYELAPNIGCRITGMAVPMAGAGEQFPTRQREAWDMVRAAVDRGLPCYADRVSWMPDYSLITGYDDVGYYYTHSNAGARGGPTPWQKLGTEDIKVLDVWRVEPCDPKPDDEVVRAALRTVLEHAATPNGWVISDGHRSGPWAFDLWADELELGHAKLDDHTWNAHFWWEARSQAVDFLKEAKRRLPGRADAAFDEAVRHYTVVRDKLGAVKDLSPFRDNADWTTLLKSPEQAALIRQAGAAELQGLAALGMVLVALGGTLPAQPAVGEGLAKASGTRLVLGGVRQVAYHTDRWRFTPFCNALDACLQYLGEPEQYDYLMCTSGAAFRMRWAAKAWDGGNSDILGMAAETLEPMRRAFRSAGYDMLPVAKAEPDNWAEDLLRDSVLRTGGELTDEAGFRRRIVESIDKGRPVIAFGVIGPPEACVITGYDERGDVLLGWNVFQEDEKAEAEPSGYFRVRDWYPKTRGLLLIGEKVGKPDAEQLDIDTLKWTLQVLRTSQVQGNAAGPAAFEAWAADMLNDEYFPKDKVDVLSARLMCHWDSMTVTAFRGGGEATAYLTAMAARQPAMATELKAAADCFENEDVVHGVAPGEEAQIARLADPAVRRKVADSILHARDMHVQAADHTEKALLAAGVELPQAWTGQAARDLERIRLVDCPPLTVAATMLVDKSPEGPARQRLNEWAMRRGLLQNPGQWRYFGFNRRDLDRRGEGYGWEAWMSCPGDAQGDGQIEIKAFPGGKYAVFTQKPEEFFNGGWGRFMAALRLWQETYGWVDDPCGRWLEEYTMRTSTGPGVPKMEVTEFHLCAPVGRSAGQDGRRLLEGVPKVGFGVVDGNVAMTPFPACLKACLESMGDDLGFERTGGKYPRDAVYAYLMGTTGAAFRLLWGPGWRGDNVASFTIYDDAGEVFRRGFGAAGYAVDVVHRGPEAQFRERVMASIRERGRPVIVHGIIGPPEECIVAGFDEGGRVAIGWNYFQDRVIGKAGVEFEPNGMFRKRDWEADAWSMLLIGDKTAAPERRGTYVEALRNALRIMRRPALRGDCANGIAAYDAWADHLLKDDEVAAGGAPDDAFIVHSDAEDVVAEGRWYASIFLKQAAGVLPEAKDELLAASECFKAEHDLVWKMWGEVGGNAPSDATRKEFLRPDVRRRIVPLIRQARDRDAEAAGHIEKALDALGVPKEDAARAPAGAAAPDAAPARMMLAGLAFPKWIITQLGCMSACLDYLGRSIPRPWLYGGTAHAFFINIHDDVDVESVTAWDDAWMLALTPNLGFRVEGMRAAKEGASEEEWRAAQARAWQFVRQSILLRRPCYGWELKAPYGDYWLITGFDDTGYYYDGWETGGPTPWRKLGELFIPVLIVRSVQLCEPAADQVVVRDALAAALAHAQPRWDKSAAEDSHFGPEAFDAWAKALEAGAAVHNHHAYNAVAWHECREMAVEFLKEAKHRLPGRADAAFDEAITHYSVVRDKLAALKALTPIDEAFGWGEERKLRSAEAASLVREAGAAEARALRVLARIVGALREEEER